MKEIRRHITIPKAEADEIRRLLATNPKDASEAMHEDDIRTYTANFGDGIEMDIKLCPMQYSEENEDNTPWTEAVLFDHGSEVCCSEPSDDLFYEWSLEYKGTEYIVEFIIEPETHMIWHNDACDIYEEVKEEYPDEDDDTIWQIAYDRIDEWLDDEEANLDKEVQGPAIIAVGTLERWDGGHAAYKKLATNNIGKALREVLSCFNGDNTFRIYAQGEHVYISQTGHDNPVNPSVFELRALTTDFDDLDDDSTKTLMNNSEPIGNIVNEVYGWEAEEEEKPADWRSQYVDEDGLKRVIPKDPKDRKEDDTQYEIIFDIDGDRYYCYIEAINVDEALGIFFRSHPTVTYDKVVDHFEA